MLCKPKKIVSDLQNSRKYIFLIHFPKKNVIFNVAHIFELSFPFVPRDIKFFFMWIYPLKYTLYEKVAPFCAFFYLQDKSSKICARSTCYIALAEERRLLLLHIARCVKKHTLDYICCVVSILFFNLNCIRNVHNIACLKHGHFYKKRNFRKNK